jgi:RNA polymerase sigma-70 factor (ECF subfamily)
MVLVTDSEFVAGMRKSDEAAFETVFRSYYERLCNYANTMLYDVDEAEEVVQNTFLTLWEQRDSIEIHTSVKSYLYRAVHNSCLNRIKHNKVKQMHGEHVRYNMESSVEGTSQMVIGKELEQQINAAIESMPQQCRTVFVLSRFENLTYAEIAEQLKISIKTVEKHMVKALKILRERLKDYLPLLLWLLINKN